MYFLAVPNDNGFNKVTPIKCDNIISNIIMIEGSFCINDIRMIE